MVDPGAGDAGKPLVSEEEELWRGILPNHVKKNEDGTIRLNSGTFRSSNPDISVFVASKTTVDACMGMNERWVGLVSIPAALPIGLDYRVVMDPRPGNPAHALIVGRITNGHSKVMAKSARWVVEPPDIV